MAFRSCLGAAGGPSCMILNLPLAQRLQLRCFDPPPSSGLFLPEVGMGIDVLGHWTQPRAAPGTGTWSQELKGEACRDEGGGTIGFPIPTFSLFYYDSPPAVVVHFFLILLCFIVVNLLPEFLLFYFLECSHRHISSWMAEQLFCVALSWRSFPSWSLSSSPPVGVGCSLHLLVLCGFLDLKQTLSLSHSESRRMIFQSSVHWLKELPKL